MTRSFSALLAGLLFGAGLTISGMTNPAKVLAFLDVFGAWDPSLAFVMVGAIITTFIGYQFILKRRAPLFSEKFRLPTRTDLTLPLVGGSALFGVGWGLSGLCPGPAIASIGFGGTNVLTFLIPMLVGIGLTKLLQS